jgi:excisionase family DNA binding protein
VQLYAELLAFATIFLSLTTGKEPTSMLIDQNTKIISVSDLSKLLNFSQFRVKSLITSGHIKAEKVNGRYIIDAKAVNEWWASLTNGKRHNEAEQDQHCAA